MLDSLPDYLLPTVLQTLCIGLGLVLFTVAAAAAAGLYARWLGADPHHVKLVRLAVVLLAWLLVASLAAALYTPAGVPLWLIEGEVKDG